MKTFSWAKRQRFAYIEAFVQQHGRINRSDLMDRYSISKPQASIDFTAYQGAAPGNLAYDATLKAYVAGPGFQARFASKEPPVGAQGEQTPDPFERARMNGVFSRRVGSIIDQLRGRGDEQIHLQRLQVELLAGIMDELRDERIRRETERLMNAPPSWPIFVEQR